MNPEIPSIPLKIVRKDNKIKLSTGKYSLELKEIEGKSQTYDFLHIEQFITNTAKLLYEEIVRKEQIKKDIRAAFTDTAEEQNDQDFVKGLLEK